MIFTEDDFQRLRSIDDIILATELANNRMDRFLSRGQLHYGHYSSLNGQISNWTTYQKRGDTHTMKGVDITEIKENERT